MKFISATISALSEYILNSTWKIQKVATSAIKLIFSHGLAKINVTQLNTMDYQEINGFDRIYANIKYFLSSRFSDSSKGAAGAASSNAAIDCSLQLIKAFIDYSSSNLLDDERLTELLIMVSQTQVSRHHY